MTAVKTDMPNLSERAIALIEREAADRATKEANYRASREQALLGQIVHNLRDGLGVDEAVALTPRLLSADDPLTLAMADGAIWLTAAVDFDGLLFAMTESGWRLRVALECIGCRRHLVVRDAQSLRALGEALVAVDLECRECWAQREEAEGAFPKATVPPVVKSRVVWPPVYDEEIHRWEVTQTECLRVIASNLAVIATALEDINANGLLR